MGQLSLFKEILSCQNCLYSWEGYAHGFSRGHIILIKNQRLLSIADDIWYLFPNGTNFDIEAPFVELGWRPLESCPKCRSLNLFPLKYDSNKMVTVECIEIKFDYFKVINGRWGLTESANKIFV